MLQITFSNVLLHNRKWLTARIITRTRTRTRHTERLPLLGELWYTGVNPGVSVYLLAESLRKNQSKIRHEFMIWYPCLLSVVSLKGLLLIELDIRTHFFCNCDRGGKVWSMSQWRRTCFVQWRWEVKQLKKALNTRTAPRSVNNDRVFLAVRLEYTHPL